MLFDEEKMSKIGVIVWIVIIALVCCSCKTKYVTIETTRTDTTYITKTERDSIWMHDSVYLHEYTKGDTIFVNLTKWKIAYRDRLRVDTFYRTKVDSISIPYPVEKELTKWQQWKMNLGGYAFGAIVAMIVAGGVWLWRKLR